MFTLETISIFCRTPLSLPACSNISMGDDGGWWSLYDGIEEWRDVNSDANSIAQQIALCTYKDMKGRKKTPVYTFLLSHKFPFNHQTMKTPLWVFILNKYQIYMYTLHMIRSDEYIYKSIEMLWVIRVEGGYLFLTLYTCYGFSETILHSKSECALTTK